jgi:LEA14-like dessication related protein
VGVTPTTRLILLPLLLLAGCTNTDRAALHIGITNISIADAAVAGSEAVFTLQISNEEIYPTIVEGESHKIFVDGNHIGDASATDTYALPQLGVLARVLKMQVSSDPAMDALRTAIRRGSGEYTIESRFKSSAGGERYTIVNKNSGTFSIQKP